MNKNLTTKDNVIQLISIVCALVSIIMTPWVNVDSLIIPKLALFFAASMYFLPLIFINFKITFQHRTAKLLIVLISFMILNLFAILVFTESPIEQQIFGKTGRGLGLLTEISTLIFLVATFKFINLKKISTILCFLLISGTISSTYAILQFYGIDFFDWYTRTNGIIGTLGNPNFQSAFSALTIPASIFFIVKSKKFIKTLAILSFFVLLLSIYLCESTQGYILLLISIVIIFLYYIRYKNIFLLGSLIVITFAAAFIVLLGTLNKGPLSSTLYKLSVQSREEFWRTALNTFKENPMFGVGLDSFGDYSQQFKSQADASRINEFTDNAHNYFLNYAANNGVLFTLLYSILTMLVIWCIVKIVKSYQSFDLGLASIISCWFCFQAQSLISPGTISLIAWNAVFTGAIIGIYCNGKKESDPLQYKAISLVRPVGTFMAFLGILFMYPLFKVDSLQLKSLDTKDALLAVKSATSYPESTLRYTRIGVELIESELWDQALVVGRSAVDFNSNSISAWALVLANPKAPLNERQIAKSEILRLDPFNKVVMNIELPSN